jgi:uncharacterized protein (DUF4213/DUF364 family)
MEDIIMSHHLLEDLLASLPDDHTPVRSVTVGAHWTAVCSRHCGLATTIIGDKPHDHTTVVHDAGRLHLKSARELAEYARSENPLEAGIGLAAIGEEHGACGTFPLHSPTPQIRRKSLGDRAAPVR